VLVNDSGKDLPWVPSWCTLIHTQGEVGVSAARNLGISVCNTAYFVPLDADDFLTSAALEKMYKAMTENPGGYVYTDFVVSPDRKRIKTGERACARMLEAMPHPITCLYASKAWNEAGGFDDTLRVGEDWDFAARVTAQGYCGVYLPEPLVYYRTGTGGNRQAMLANMQPLDKMIYERYADKLGGNMACGCSKGGNSVAQVAAQAGVPSSFVAASGADTGLVLVEMIAEGISNVRFNARPSGRQYTFSSSGVRSKQYVERDDAAYFVGTFPHQFRYADSTQPVGIAG